MTKRLAMCSPDYFDVVYEINPWMHKGVKVDRNKAKKEWQTLGELYKKLGLEVSIIPPGPDLPDMVFAANGFMAIGKTALLSSFRYPERRKEARYFKKWLEKQGFQVVETGGVIYEGQGDTFLVGDKLFQGWGFRSELKVKPILEKAFPGYEVITIELVDDLFYHFDTCFFPVNPSLCFYFTKALTAQSENEIKKNFSQAIGVTDAEALTFGLNSVVVGDKIVVPASSPAFGDRVKSMGFEVVLADMSEFLKSGGGVKCVTNEIWE